MKVIKIIGMVVGIAAMVLGWICFDWKLSLVIFLALMGNNFGMYGSSKFLFAHNNKLN